MRAVLQPGLRADTLHVIHEEGGAARPVEGAHLCLCCAVRVPQLLADNVGIGDVPVVVADLPERAVRRVEHLHVALVRVGAALKANWKRQRKLKNLRTLIKC